MSTVMELPGNSVVGYALAHKSRKRDKSTLAKAIEKANDIVKKSRVNSES
jgi:hypothetical protein